MRAREQRVIAMKRWLVRRWPVWVRWVNAVVFVTVLLFLAPWLAVTDGPGFVYILPVFALVTLPVLLVRAVAAITVRDAQARRSPNLTR